jgi:hypothetical protein
LTGDDLRRIRRRCGMGVAQFGRALGLGTMDGGDDTVARKVRSLEARTDELSARVSLAALRLKALANKRARL